MAKKSRRDEGGQHGLDRVFELLDAAPAGLHDITPPADALPAGLPDPLIELYARCDGAHLYHDTLELAPSAEVTLPEVAARSASDARWRFGTIDGEAVSIDTRGRIWRADPSLDDDVCEGSRLDRWLAGLVDALALVYDHEGEFNDGVFDEDGELLPEVRERQLRACLRRDAAAPAARWRLAHLLSEADTDDARAAARDQLEQVVADDPTFAWAWLDLARISERLGELPGAIDEARMAAQTAEGARHPQAGYFWAQVARLASRHGDELLRAEAATKTSLLAPDLRRAQLDGARASLADDDRASARGLLELLRAVWPRDLEVLALARDLG